MAERRLSTSSPTSRFIAILTVLPISLAVFAFYLQWRGGYSDPATVAKLWGLEDSAKFPGWVQQTSPQEVTGIVAAKSLCGGSGMPHHFPHLPSWQVAMAKDQGPKICITATTSSSIETILVWLFFHQSIGVTNFYLFVEGAAASENSTVILDGIKGVKVIHRTKELEEKQAKSRIWNESWLSSFFWKPCNYELFVKQSLNMELAIVMAREDGMEWIAHVDTDELLHPGGTGDYSLKSLFSNIGKEVDTVIFPNYESAVERMDVTMPFVEVSLFKKNFDHVSKEVYFGHYREATRGNPNYFLTYGNGKSAARVQDFLRPNGAHRWHNYAKNPVEFKFPEAAVLHFTYAKFSDLTSRRDRCGCKPTKDDVQKCFMLEFDRLAFIVASTTTEDQMRKWYLDHVVWHEKELKDKLIKKGLLGRLYEPQIIVRGLMQSKLIEQTIASGMSRAAGDAAVGGLKRAGEKEGEGQQTASLHQQEVEKNSVVGGLDKKREEEILKGAGLRGQKTGRRLLTEEAEEVENVLQPLEAEIDDGHVEGVRRANGDVASLNMARPSREVVLGEGGWTSISSIVSNLTLISSSVEARKPKDEDLSATLLRSSKGVKQELGRDVPAAMPPTSPPSLESSSWSLWW